MNKAQAIAEVNNGKKVSHHYFTDNEFIYKDEKGVIRCEDGVKVTPEFWSYRTGEEWNMNWFIVE